MIAPQYARAYVKTNKNDAADAEAICAAALRPTMRFVRPKSLDQQAMQMLHRARDLLIRQRTMLVNALRGHLAEFGITAGHGIGNVKSLLIKFEDIREKLPSLAGDVIDAVTHQLAALQVKSRSWTARCCRGTAQAKRVHVLRQFRVWVR
jgi:transposase